MERFMDVLLGTNIIFNSENAMIIALMFSLNNKFENTSSLEIYHKNHSTQTRHMTCGNTWWFIKTLTDFQEDTNIYFSLPEGFDSI